MADFISNGTSKAGVPDLIPEKYKDLGDGAFAKVVAVNSADPIQLTGDVVVDTLGALNNSKELDPDSASATIPSLLRGILDGLTSYDYETVAASQTDQVLGVTGGVGDYLKGILIIPGTSAAGVVSIKDGNGSSISIFVGGGVTPLSDLKPFFVSLGIKTKNATTPGWKITTGANVSVVGVGKFT